MRKGLPSGARQVEVEGTGTFAFQPVGNTSFTTAIDVYFHPAGGAERAPGYGRYRLRISDELAWNLEVERVYRLDESVVRQALPIAEAWLRSQEVSLFFQIHDAASIELRDIERQREQLTWTVAARRSALQRAQRLSDSTNEPPAMTPDLVVGAEKALASFEERMALREPRLRELVGGLRAWPQTRIRRLTVQQILEDYAAKYAAPQVEITVCAP